MKKIINKKHNKNEPWFKWLTRELNSYEAFQDFESGKSPKDVAEDFISRNTIAISEVFEQFDRKARVHQVLHHCHLEYHHPCSQGPCQYGHPWPCIRANRERAAQGKQ